MFSTKQANIFLVGWLFAFILMNYLFADLSGGSFPVTFIGGQVAGALVPVFLAFLYVKSKGLGLGSAIKEIIPMKKVDFSLLFFVVLMGFLVQPLGMVISAMSSLVGFDDTPMQGIQILLGMETWLSFLMVAIIPSIFEELVCRGVFIAGYRRVSPQLAAIINGIAFGIMHMNFRQFFYAFFLGYVIAFVVIKSGNVVYAFVMHFVINGSQFAFSRAMANVAAPPALPVNGLYEVPAIPEILPALMLLLGFAALCAYLCLKIYKRFAERCRVLYPAESAAPRNEPVDKLSLIVFLVVGAAFMLLI